MKLDVLAFGAHPDDVELGCAGTIAKAVSLGKTVGIIDLTRGELGTRGTPEIREKEAAEAAKILGVSLRENLQFRDGFFVNDEAHQMAIIQKIRKFRPDVVLCNAVYDRHIDHARGNQLVGSTCFLSGLRKIQTFDKNKNVQDFWRPKLVLEYIQWYDIKPDIIFDISGFLETKVKAVKAFSSQIYNPESKGENTPISSANFLESVSYRAKNMGRLISTEAGEGFTSKQPLAIKNIDSLLP